MSDQEKTLLPPQPEPPKGNDDAVEAAPLRELQQTGSFRSSEIDQIPMAPGVYIMIDARGKVIYVGKAINLRARVRQYFAEKGGDPRPSVPLIRQSLHHIDTIITGSEKEAFLLENTLIKRHRPEYNVRLRDDKTYVSLRIDLSEEWPRPEIVRARKQDRALYFGPYVGTQSLREMLRSLQQVFPLRGCSKEKFRNRTRPCLLYQIGLCCGVCGGKMSKEEYYENLRGVIGFLKGHTSEVADVLRKRMIEHSEKMEYERAAVVRDQLAALEKTMEKQQVFSHGAESRDVIGYQEERGQAAIALLFFRNGELIESSKWVLPVHGEPQETSLAQFMGQYYNPGRFVPEEIFVPFLPEDPELIEEWLSDLRGSRVRLTAPQRGDKAQLMDMANANARELLARKLSGKREAEEVLNDLAERLHMDHPPRVIECYDIATLQGFESVGAQVSFLDGEPNKAGYRLYRIRGIEGQDDFAMMRQVLARRLTRALKTNADLPDLIVVDGGKGQLAMAVEVFQELGIESIALAALVKSHLKSDDEGRSARTPEHLFLPNRKNPVVFPPYAPSFYLLQRLRDEAHRFVNTFHAKRRAKANLRSSLQDIEGVGPQRAKALLRHFGSLARVKNASVEDLAAAPTMTAPIAERIYREYHAADLAKPDTTDLSDPSDSSDSPPK